MQECVHRYVHIHTFANMNTVNTNTQAILYKWVFLASQIKQTKTCNTDICVYVYGGSKRAHSRAGASGRTGEGCVPRRLA